MYINRLKPYDEKCTLFGVNEKCLKARNLDKEAFKESLRQNVFQTRRFW